MISRLILRVVSPVLPVASKEVDDIMVDLIMSVSAVGSRDNDEVTEELMREARGLKTVPYCTSPMLNTNLRASRCEPSAKSGP